MKTVYISTGRKAVMHTLREMVRTEKRIVDSYIKTLTLDAETSISLAQEYADKHNITFDGIVDSPYNERGSDCSGRSSVLSITISDIDMTFKLAQSGEGWYGYASDTFFKVWKIEKEYLKSVGFSFFKLKETNDWMVYVKGDMYSITLKPIDVNEIDKQIEFENAISQHVGNVGERITLSVTCTGIQDYAGTDFYGNPEMKTISEFTDASGNVLKYFNSVKDITGYVVVKGDEVSFKGTVKAHSEYKGQKQTMLSRCGKATHMKAELV